MDANTKQTFASLALLVAFVVVIYVADAGLKTVSEIAGRQNIQQVAAVGGCAIEGAVPVSNCMPPGPPSEGGKDGLLCAAQLGISGQFAQGVCIGGCCKVLSYTSGTDAAQMGGASTLGQIASQFLQQLLQQLMGGGQGGGGGGSSAGADYSYDQEQEKPGILNYNTEAGSGSSNILGGFDDKIFSDDPIGPGDISGGQDTTGGQETNIAKDDEQNATNTQNNANAENSSDDAAEQDGDSVVTTYEYAKAVANNSILKSPQGATYSQAVADERFAELDEFDRELYGTTFGDSSGSSSTGGISLAQLELEALEALARRQPGAETHSGSLSVPYESLSPAEIRTLQDYYSSNVAVSGGLGPYSGNPLSNERYQAEDEEGDESQGGGFWRRVVLFFGSLFGL